MALSSLDALLSRPTDTFFIIFRSGRLFPNGVLFIKFVLQAALLANTCDIWRGPELIIEYFNKSRATTNQELKEAEQVPPFMFGFEYQYFMVIFTVTMFYSCVLPIIIPCGFAYLLLKHFVDKVLFFLIIIIVLTSLQYNLLYHYPKTPDSTNTLSRLFSNRSMTHQS